MLSLRSGPIASFSRPTGRSRTSTTRRIGSTRRASANPTGSRSAASTPSNYSSWTKQRAIPSSKNNRAWPAKHRAVRDRRRSSCHPLAKSRTWIMRSFVYTGLPSKVLFGFGTLDRVAEEVRLLDCRRALVLSTPQQEVQANDLAGRLGQLCVGTFTQAAMHTPVAITEQALAVARERQADCTVALGGGSTTGLGKAIALRTDLPQIVVPTTYAGSEMTPILGETRDGAKTTLRDPKVLPEVVIYDVDLT